MSALLEMLGCRHPIIQGPIAALNEPKFVAAVSEAGAFGMLALGFSNKEDAKRLVAGVRALTAKPFGANLMVMNQENPKILEVLAEAGVKTVTTSAGSPKALYPHIHALGMKGLHVLLSLNTAVKAVEAGADGVIVSGSESGGLRSLGSESSTMVLVPLVADAVKVPIVAAGGIADRRGYRAALALGAQGVQIGTRLIATEESPAPAIWKEAILKCGDGGTVLLNLGGMNMRVIQNPKLEKEMKDPAVTLSERYNLFNAPKGWLAGDTDLFPAGAGQVAALIRDIKPVRDVIEEFMA
ncbi:MAG: nitronate monooxygenase [Deltaproteobacteria bacterium HGW-Deltaproteobacteria-19]|jgi:enoyl-[acyl-carrier protein] reductase II|nr:MAG: nitronate monooxygenase [Deltaproteobacteria bacterium HGW-Deltaproteobacteria-19]